jgi:predicted SnoaL-like aldol condensation-catalyzing enzyme
MSLRFSGEAAGQERYMAEVKITPDQEAREKETALKFFSLLSPDKLKEARGLFTPGCRHHNPYASPGMDALLEAIKEAQQRDDMPKDGVFSIKHVIVDGDLVAAYTIMQSRSNKSVGFRQVHLFRFEGDRIAEYWDVTQLAPAGVPNASNMF